MIWRRRAILYGLISTTACFELADEIADMALTWIIVSQTESPAWTGFAGALAMIPLILGAFFGGALVDRIGVRRTALFAAVLGLGVAVAIPAMLSQIGVVLPLLLACVFAAELFDAPAEIAVEARLPELARFGRMPLERVNGLDELVETLAALVGPLVAGMAMALLGPVATLWIVAAVAAPGVVILVCALPQRRHEVSRRRAAARRTSMGDVWRFIWKTPLLRWIVVMAAIMTTLLAGLEGVLLPVLIQAAERSAVEFGWVLAAAGAGAALGTAGYAWKGHLVSPRIVVVGGILGLSASIGAMAFLSQIGAVCLVVALGGAIAAPMSPLLSTQLQRHAPRALRGRVLGVTTGAILACIPMGLLGLGLFAEAVGPEAVLIGVAVALAGLGVAALASPTLAALKPGGRGSGTATA